MVGQRGRILGPVFEGLNPGCHLHSGGVNNDRRVQAAGAVINVITAKLGVAQHMLATQLASVQHTPVGGEVGDRNRGHRVAITGPVGMVFFKSGFGHIRVTQAGHGGQLGLRPL